MGFIDLHIHTTASDGSETPSAIIEKAHIKQLTAIAITDHDTASGIREAKASAENYPDLYLIPGIEMSSTYGSEDIHILGYFIDESSVSFHEGIQFFLDKRNQRNELILSNLSADGIVISHDDLTCGHSDTIITRAHFAKALVSHGYAKDISEAFSKYLYYGSRYCPNHKDITIEEVMVFYHINHIWPSLAHPMLYHLSDIELNSLIQMMIPLGLRGIEVYHSSHKSSDCKKLMKLCKKYNLLPTGGSDYHGANKPNVSLGVVHGGACIEDSIFYDLLSDYELLNKNP